MNLDRPYYFCFDQLILDQATKLFAVAAVQAVIDSAVVGVD